MEIGSREWELDLQVRRLKHEIKQKTANYEQLKEDKKRAEESKNEVHILINSLKDNIPNSWDEAVTNLNKIKHILKNSTNPESKVDRTARIFLLKSEIKKLEQKNEKFQFCVDMLEQKTKEINSIEFKNEHLKLTLENLEDEKQEALNKYKAFEKQKEILLNKCGKMLTDSNRLREEINIMKEKVEKQNNLIQELKLQKEKQNKSKIIKHNKMS
ncbi:hypothetical protein PVAND_011516 [Polypedilum vanderplanki]|uniref:Uncharacterized protein n=1 Tax=Polypedilum vanderplanki TaxID=319348 RepID=A0A9J6CJU7_POLVA|nr:hypothetical protein PVAND_011516 [Polypedilum vanderplanki]